MRKTLLFSTVVLVALALAACSGPASSAESNSHTESGKPPTVQEQPTPADLTGQWVEENAGGSTQTAIITADTISVNWVNAEDNTTAVYWVGTYQAPTTAGDFTWTSTRDEEATKSALLASTDPAKEFGYAGGKLSYKVTAMGVTKTVTLVKK